MPTSTVARIYCNLGDSKTKRDKTHPQTNERSIWNWRIDQNDDSTGSGTDWFLQLLYWMNGVDLVDWLLVSTFIMCTNPPTKTMFNVNHYCLFLSKWLCKSKYEGRMYSRWYSGCLLDIRICTGWTDLGCLVPSFLWSVFQCLVEKVLKVQINRPFCTYSTCLCWHHLVPPKAHKFNISF
jgi:hypothetical protein